MAAHGGGKKLWITPWMTRRPCMVKTGHNSISSAPPTAWRETRMWKHNKNISLTCFPGPPKMVRSRFRSIWFK